jgi:putative peptidoglycan lipid II flippase
MIGKILDFRKRPLMKDALKTTILSTIGKAAGFLIPFFLAAWFGATKETDAFFFVYGLILLLSGIFARVVETVIVPFITEAKTNDEDVGKFVMNILILSGIGLLAVAGIFILVIKPVLSVITRFDDQTLRLIYQLLIETAPLIILLTWTSILTGTLNSYKKFSFPAVSPAFRAAVNLAIIFLLKDMYGIHSIALGYIGGEIVRLAVLFAVIEKLKLFKLFWSLKFDPKLWQFLRTASYQIIGMAAGRFNLFVDKVMASWLEKGSVSILHYADRLRMIPVAFLGAGFMVTLLSHVSQRYSEEGSQRLTKDVKKAVPVVAFITLPMMLFLILFHQPIVKIAFGWGELAQEKLSEIGWVWVCYLFGFVPCMVGGVYEIGHFVLKNTKVLMRCAFYTVFLNVLLNLVFMRLFDVAGIALATSIIYIFRILYLRSSFYKGV